MFIMLVLTDQDQTVKGCNLTYLCTSDVYGTDVSLFLRESDVTKKQDMNRIHSTTHRSYSTVCVAGGGIFIDLTYSYGSNGATKVYFFTIKLVILKYPSLWTWFILLLIF